MRNLQHALQRAAFGLEPVGSQGRQSRPVAGPVLIEVRDLSKAFDIPDESAGRLRPLRRPATRRLEALRSVSFDVRRGEFFGIVGRNGSGKSTLLKILASIYRADAGTIRMAGRLAPFIELGVGFNVDLTARENVVLNGVMMGLGRREAASRLDAILDFAELREFVDLKLKNYSSGMLVRLAFAAMVEADADVMLVDEVLAVGDASFAAKCIDVFKAKRDAGRTVLLVSHDMAAVESFCDRAMLLHEGEMRFLGDPGEAVLGYYRLNFAGVGGDDGPASFDGQAAVILEDVWLEDATGRRVEEVPVGEPFGLRAVARATAEVVAPAFRLEVSNVDGVPVFGVGKTLFEDADEARAGVVQPGQRMRFAARIDAGLVPGRFSVRASVGRNERPGDLALPEVEVLDFLVRGPDPLPGMISVRAEVAEVIGGQA